MTRGLALIASNLQNRKWGIQRALQLAQSTEPLRLRDLAPAYPPPRSLLFPSPQAYRKRQVLLRRHRAAATSEPL